MSNIKIFACIIGFILSILIIMCKYLCKSPDNENCKYSTAATLICLCVHVCMGAVGGSMGVGGECDREGSVKP